MDHPVRFGLLFATGVSLGLLLLPVVPELTGAFLVVCALILMVWVCAAAG